MKAYKRNIKNAKSFHRKRRSTKMIDKVMGDGEKLLKKKKRGEKRKDETKNLDIKKK